MSEEDPYTDPATGILRNKLGLKSAAALDKHERRITTQRARSGLPKGKFDLAHLRAIHRHLFQDVYDWAGALRTVEMTKGGSRFQFSRYIETGMADVHRRLVAQNMLKGLDAPAFAEAAAVIIGDINFVHPFREGNGRTQLIYLKLLAEAAGHSLDLTRLNGPAWIASSQDAMEGKNGSMAEEIRSAIIE